MSHGILTFYSIWLFMFIYPFDCKLKLKRFDRLTERTTGQIYTIEKGNIKYRKSHDLYKVRYLAEGEEYIGEPIYDNENILGKRVGDVVSILYDPSEPNKFILEDKFEEGKQSAEQDYEFARKKILPIALLITLLIILYCYLKFN